MSTSPPPPQRGVVVMNTPFGNSITTAEHAIALMFALARQLPEADASTQAGKWEKNRFMGVEVTGKTLGLIGAGNIGSIVASRALGLKMKVVAFDPFLTPERAIELGVEKADLDTLLARADFITLHTPLTDQTRGILDRAALARTKRGVRIINCARGGLIDEEALKDALDSGQVGGAALDVFEAEPAKASPLFGTPNFISTPHLGASTSEAQVNVAIQVAEQMSDFLLLGGVTNAINMPSLTAEEAPRLKPYMALADKLGRLVGQIVGEDVRSIAVEVEGAAAQLNPEADHRRGAGGADGDLFADREHGQRADAGQGTRARRDRDPPRPRGRLSHAAARHRRHEVGRPLRRGDLVRQQGAAAGRHLRGRGRGRTRRQHDLPRQHRRAGLHRQARHRRWARPGSTSRPSTSAAAPRVARRSRWCRSTARCRPRWSSNCARIEGVREVVPLSF